MSTEQTCFFTEKPDTVTLFLRKSAQNTFFVPQKRRYSEKKHFFIDFLQKMSIIAPLCSLNIEMNRGRVAEWSKAAVLKTVDVYASVGSNPTSSARNMRRGVREAEGARLLSGYGTNNSIEGPNPSLSATFFGRP